VKIGATSFQQTKAALTPLTNPAEPGQEGREEPLVRKRPSHVLLGWRRLEAPVIAQILAAMPERPALTPAEAAQRYKAPPLPPATHRRGQA